jgi:hypothetical protein
VISVTFGGAKAHFKIVGDGKLVATVPARAQSGPIVVTSRLTQVQSKASFTIRPSAAKLPRVTGAPRVGHRLHATAGVWYGETPTSYSFQWLGCNARGRACKPVPGATHETLQLGPSLVGERYRVLVTAHTASGTGRATSAPTRIVTR